MNILFVTWDGPQVAYLEGLFLPIFQELRAVGLKFHVLQFTWDSKERIRVFGDHVREAGIPYRSAHVWRKPLAVGSMLSAIFGSRQICKAIHDWRIDTVLPRSTMPALATLIALRGRQFPIVFDADGLPLDERVDFGGQLSTGLTYRFLRDVEAQAVRKSQVVLTRTAKAVEILQSRAGAGVDFDKFHVVKNGRDIQLFRPLGAMARQSVRGRLGIGVDAPLLIYVGSLGGQYCLPEMLLFFKLLLDRRSDAHFLILTGSPEKVGPILTQYSGIESSVTTLSVPPTDVPEYISSADLGLALRRNSFSMQGVAPIKLGEYLLCGLPVIASRDVGDAELIGPDVGLSLSGFREEDFQEAVEWFVSSVLSRREQFRLRCTEVGRASFSLETSVKSYWRAFRELGGALQ